MNVSIMHIKTGMTMKESIRIFMTGVVAVCAAAASLSFAQSLLRPVALRPGDKIAIISPASAPDKSYVDGGAEVLRSWGLVPVYGKHVLTRNGTFAGSIDERRADLEWAFGDDSIKAIMCSRGGYGSIQELLKTDVDIIKRNPKWIVGYSDITAIHGCMLNQGIMSIHAHMLEHLNRSHGNDTCDVYLHDILFGKMPKYELPYQQYNHCGVAEGRLVGGNLSLITSVVGSKFDMLRPADDAPLVLFVEDVGENLVHLSRMFYHLVASGAMSRVKGVIFGDFNGYTPTSDFKTVEEMFHSIVKDYDIPVCYKFPCGHVSRNYPMVEGAMVRLSVSADGTTLQYL